MHTLAIFLPTKFIVWQGLAGSIFMKGRGGRTTDARMAVPRGCNGKEGAAAICGSCTQLRLDLGVSAESQTARTSGKFPAKQLFVCCISYLFLLETLNRLSRGSGKSGG